MRFKSFISEGDEEMKEEDEMTGDFIEKFSVLCEFLMARKVFPDSLLIPKEKHRRRERIIN